jgi:sialate O-acetylesterase
MKAPLLSFLFLLGASAPGDAAVRLPAIFSEHMVLMQSAAVPIWGKADPGEQVTVGMNGKSAQATAGADGRWKLTLDLKDSGAGPFEMTVAGKNKIVIPDVVVGQVWLLIGQSNPQRLLKESANAPAEIARSANPLLRTFRVQQRASDAPQDDARGAWTVAGPATAADFSAIGYYFGKKLTGELKTPVGVINGTWGGTFIEAWTSDEALKKDPQLWAGEQARRKEMQDYQPLRAAYVKAGGDWLKAGGREDRPCPDPAAYAGPNVSTADWTPVNLPGKVAGPNLPACGAIWIRKEIEVPAAVQGLLIKAGLGQMTAFEQTYWNGEKIFEMPYLRLPGAGYTHYFAIPQDKVVPGKAAIAIRLYAPVLSPALASDPARFAIGPIPLAGRWLAKAEYSLPALAPEVAATAPNPPRQPPAMKASGIFNGVVHPLIPYGLAGILWYQGESNTGIAYAYRAVFPLFIQDLREKWDQPNLPFYFCQLANSLPKRSTPSESAWAELRESQSLALKLPNTAQAVLIDLGESADVHFRNKLDVGNRLARIALALRYGRQDIVYSGPVYDSMAIEGSKIRLKFTHAEGGLVARPAPKTYDVMTLLNMTAPLVRNSPGSQLEGFAICGADRHWVWANAKIDGDTVLVWAGRVPAPVAVRYAWADNPTCNLYNGGGLPASPFRTDDFPVPTQRFHFGSGPGRF